MTNGFAITSSSLGCHAGGLMFKGIHDKPGCVDSPLCATAVTIPPRHYNLLYSQSNIMPATA